MAVRNVAALSAETVLSAFTRKNVTALGLGSTNRFWPAVVPPKFVRAAAVVVAPVPPFAIATVPVTFAAVPVVFWFSVGISAATKARNVGTPAAPFGAAKIVFAVWLAKFDGVTASVPLRVRLPEDVTVPERLRPLTVPVPPTDVTVPVVLEVPAPMAVRKAAASSVLTVLSALIRGNLIAATFASVKRFPPSVVAPNEVRPVAATRFVLPPSHCLRSLLAVSHVA
jgi:hypothetical protein